jgi:hypothetical protein
VSEETGAYMVARPRTGGWPYPSGPARRGCCVLRSTWLNRELQVEYVDASGMAAEASGILLDTYPAGPVLSHSMVQRPSSVGIRSGSWN